MPAGFDTVADPPGSRDRSTLQLLEDEKLLGPQHSDLASIIGLGRGRYLHREASLFFSTSDNSDPNWNERKYEMDVPNVLTQERRLRVTFVPAEGAP